MRTPAPIRCGDHLLWQINLSHFSPVDTAIAQAIVYGLDEDGFLQETIAEIRASLAPELLVEEDEVLAVLHRVQRLEPVGVATRDPAECIRVQLSALTSDTPGRDLALRIAQRLSRPGGPARHRRTGPANRRPRTVPGGGPGPDPVAGTQAGSAL